MVVCCFGSPWVTGMGGLYSVHAEEEMNEVRGLLADILRREEEAQKLTPTDPALKVLLSALETDLA